MVQSASAPIKAPSLDPSAPSTASLLLKLRARDDVSDEEAEVIAGMVEPTQAVGPHLDLVTEGDRPTRSTLLVEGFAARYKLLDNGARQITAVHTAGDFIDLHSFLLHQMDHGICTMGKCRITKVPHQTLRDVSETHPHLSRMFWLLTLIDAGIHREWLVAMGRRSAEQHFAHFVLELETQLRLVGLASDGAFSFPATQTELGDILGLSSVHVNRVLQNLRARELVSWQSGQVHILDHDRLSALAQFDDVYLHLRREPR